MTAIKRFEHGAFGTRVQAPREAHLVPLEEWMPEWRRACRWRRIKEGLTEAAKALEAATLRTNAATEAARVAWANREGGGSHEP